MAQWLAQLIYAFFGLYLPRNERVNMGWAVASRAQKKAAAKGKKKREAQNQEKISLAPSILLFFRVYSLLLCFSGSSAPSPNSVVPRFAAVSVAVHGLRRRGRPGRGRRRRPDRPAPAAARCGGPGVLGRRALRVHQRRERRLPVQPQRAAREGGDRVGAGAVRVGQREHLPPA
jgi:hypothetical protein